jgi:ketosteroid isomerase-like protein
MLAAMSDENVATLRQGIAAFNRGDIDAALETVGDGVEWRPVILPLLGGEVIRGRDALREFFTSEIIPGVEGFRVEPLEIEDLGDHVLVKVAYRGRIVGSEADLEQLQYTLFTFESGKIARMCDYGERGEALAATGVRG